METRQRKGLYANFVIMVMEVSAKLSVTTKVILYAIAVQYLVTGALGLIRRMGLGQTKTGGLILVLAAIMIIMIRGTSYGQ